MHVAHQSVPKCSGGLLSVTILEMNAAIRNKHFHNVTLLFVFIMLSAFSQSFLARPRSRIQFVNERHRSQGQSSNLAC